MKHTSRLCTDWRGKLRKRVELRTAKKRAAKLIADEVVVDEEEV